MFGGVRPPKGEAVQYRIRRAGVSFGGVEGAPFTVPDELKPGERVDKLEEWVRKRRLSRSRKYQLEMRTRRGWVRVASESD